MGDTDTLALTVRIEIVPVRSRATLRLQSRGRSISLVLHLFPEPADPVDLEFDIVICAQLSELGR